MISLLTELLGETRRIATIIILLIASVYISGFLIVNMYLQEFGVVKIEIMQSQFVSAGLLYLVMESTAGFLTILASIPAIALLSLTSWLWSHPQRSEPPEEQEADNWQARLLNDRFQRILDRIYARLEALPRFSRVLASILLISLALFSFVIGCDRAAYGSQKLLTDSLIWADKELKNIHNLKTLIETLIIHTSYGIFAVFVLGFYARRLHPPVLLFSTISVIILFFVSQTYSIMWFSGQLYGNLPRSIGGGKPMLVQFVLKPDKIETVETLNLLDSQRQNNTEAKLKTDLVRLVDYVITDGKPEFYSVLPCRPPKRCLAVEFTGDIVDGLIHCATDQD